MVELYRRRWTVEQVFRTLKSQGIAIEDSFIADGDALENLAATALIAAIRVAQCVHARGQPGALIPAARVFRPADMPVLKALVRSLRRQDPEAENPFPPDTLAWATWVIARLGGWKGYASERPPGPITMHAGFGTLRRHRTGASPSLNLLPNATKTYVLTLGPAGGGRGGGFRSPMFGLLHPPPQRLDRDPAFAGPGAAEMAIGRVRLAQIGQHRRKRGADRRRRCRGLASPGPAGRRGGRTGRRCARSSMAMQPAGSSPIASSTAWYTSGAGFLRGTASPATITSNSAGPSGPIAAASSAATLAGVVVVAIARRTPRARASVSRRATPGRRATAPAATSAV